MRTDFFENDQTFLLPFAGCRENQTVLEKCSVYPGKLITVTQ
jgi:hypothetical protein